MKCMGEYCSYWVDDNDNPSIALCMKTNTLFNLDESTPELEQDCEYIEELSKVCHQD